MAIREHSAPLYSWSANYAPLLFGLAGAGTLALAYQVFYPIFVMKLMCFAILAMAFNLLLGYTCSLTACASS
jgi:ABC-type branched-subunit amino acid transport system permease subunit